MIQTVKGIYGEKYGKISPSPALTPSTRHSPALGSRGLFRHMLWSHTEAAPGT